MIPQFPEFKKLELSDKEEVESCTNKYPPFSDFEFGSLYAWDIAGLMKLCFLDTNLVLLFSDYITGEPFYTFIGTNKVNETTARLLDLSLEEGHKPLLKLIPETVANLIDANSFVISADRDHFDYIYATEQHITHNGSALKTIRNNLSQFLKLHHAEVIELDLSNEATKEEIHILSRRWADSKIYTDSNDPFALSRFLDVSSEFEYLAIGVKLAGVLEAFNISVLCRDRYANCLFAKANVQFRGIYSFLMHETAKRLSQDGYVYLNYEQDLGIPKMRRAKTAFRPDSFLRKYQIRPL